MKRLIALIVLVLLAPAAQAAESQIVVKAWCPVTHREGYGRGLTLLQARDIAIRDCINNGGLPECCYKYNKQIEIR